MITITDEQFKEWNDAITCAEFGSSGSIKLFANKYPDLYKHMSSMLRKRTKLRSTIQAYRDISCYIYWGALTWNEEQDSLCERTKRAQALRFFDKFFKLYTFVEEYGEEEGRYHIHFFGILKDSSITYDLMRDNWHSYLQVECLYKYYDIKKKITYVTKYCVKQVPRIRMDKRSIKLLKDYKLNKHWINIGFDCFKSDYFNKISDLLDLPF